VYLPNNKSDYYLYDPFERSQNLFLFGPPNVEKMKARRDVKGLIKALAYRKDSNVRRAAACALGEIKDARAVKPLIAALKDKDWDVCKAVAEVLLQIGDPCATEPLVDELILRLKDPPHSSERITSEWEYRQQAARLLISLYEKQPELRPRILAVRELAERPHTDQVHHYEEYIFATEGHNETAHWDWGIGIEFPL